MHSDNRAHFDTYNHRPDYFENINRDQWEDWRWQHKNAIRNTEQLKKIFPNISQEQILIAEAWEARGLRFQITPYLQAVAEKDSLGNPIRTDPSWRQFFPSFDELLAKSEKQRADEYSPEKENWEHPGEMLTPIAHHKYDNRVILYTTDICLTYCQYCLRSLQSNAKEEKHGNAGPHWEKTLKAIRGNPDIEEVIFSGGDPLSFDNNIIEKMLKDIRNIPTIKAIRIHTRAYTHNPYRFDEAFSELLNKYAVTEMAVHIVHPNEITKNFLDCLDRIRSKGPRVMLLAQIPLIKHVNDCADILRKLFMELYVIGIKPYYLLHNMPNIPAAASQRTSVKRGVEILNEIGRRISHPAMPEYIIVHRTGKRTVPLLTEGTPDFKFEFDSDGNPVIRFKDWKGNWEVYIDGQ